MTSSDSDGVRLELHHDAPDGRATLSWDLETLTDGPEGAFLALDGDGNPRLFLQPADLLRIQHGPEGEEIATEMGVDE